MIPKKMRIILTSGYYGGNCVRKILEEFSAHTVFTIVTILLCCPLWTWGQVATDYPDNSPYTADFMKMGLPTVHQLWTVKEFDQTFKLLDRIYQMDKFSMPRYRSAYSHEVFARLTAFENFDYLLDEKINFGHRVAALEKLRKVPLRVLVYYWENKENKERFGKEVMQCMLMRVYGNNQVKKLYEQLKIQLGGRAEYRQLMAQGSAIDNALVASVDDILILLETESERYDRKELQEFVQNVKEILPQTWAQLPPYWVKNFKKRLKKVRVKNGK